MSAARILLCFTCLVVAMNSCLIPDTKGDQEIHVFHIGSPENEAEDETDIIQLHIPDVRRRRRTFKDDVNFSIFPCKKDKDCPPKSKCSTKTSKCRKIKSPSTRSSNTLKSLYSDEGVYKYYLSKKS